MQQYYSLVLTSVTVCYLDILHEHSDVGEVIDFGRGVEDLRRLLTPLTKEMQGVL